MPPDMLSASSSSSTTSSSGSSATVVSVPTRTVFGFDLQDCWLVSAWYPGTLAQGTNLNLSTNPTVGVIL
eukprot:1149884-Rhodomonas_salina.3